jgi:hypothetical protein
MENEVLLVSINRDTSRTPEANRVLHAQLVLEYAERRCWVECPTTQTLPAGPSRKSMPMMAIIARRPLADPAARTTCLRAGLEEVKP